MTLILIHVNQWIRWLEKITGSTQKNRRHQGPFGMLFNYNTTVSVEVLNQPTVLNTAIQRSGTN